MLLPSGYRFLVSPVTLQGPCSARLTLQVDGTALAPPDMDSWPKPRRPLQWLNFKWLDGFTIQGAGAVDGQSTNLLQNSSPSNSPHQVIVSYSVNYTMKIERKINHYFQSSNFRTVHDISIKIMTNRVYLLCLVMQRYTVHSSGAKPTV